MNLPINARRRAPIGDSRGITNGLLTVNPNPGQTDAAMRLARAECNQRGGTFDPRTGNCATPTAPPPGAAPPDVVGSDWGVMEEKDSFPYIFGFAMVAAAGAIFILARKEK